LLDQLHKIIKETLIEATNQIMKVYNNNSNKKRKYWWCASMQKYHVMVCVAYKSYLANKSNEYKYRYYEAKKLFKKQKKLNQKLKSAKVLERIEKLFKKDQDGFWHSIKKMSRKDNNVNIPINDLENHYKILFNSHNNINPDQMQDDDEKLKLKLQEMEQKYEKIELKKIDVEEVIRSLPNGKSAGYSTLVYENYKFCTSNELIKALTAMFNSMIRNTITPNDFNLSIIKPLIKDEKQIHEVSNTRPVAVSEPDNNIFERLILNEVNKDYKEEDEQLGFKSNSSCSHAIFVVIQMINICKQRNKACYVCALDASKAFDKVVRSRL
jgi:hypothetical protein